MTQRFGYRNDFNGRNQVNRFACCPVNSRGYQLQHQCFILAFAVCEYI